MLALIVCGIFFAVTVKPTFVASTETDGVYRHTRTDIRIFRFSWSRGKSNASKVLIGDMLTVSKEQRQQLLDIFSRV